MLRQRLSDNVKTYGIEAVLKRDQEEYGVLSLVVRTRNSWGQGPLIQTLAAWNPWMWAYSDGTYLRGLLLLAIALAVLRAVLMYINNYAAAPATIEGSQRLGRAGY